MTLPADGRYVVAVWNEAGATGRYTLVVGQREVFGGDPAFPFKMREFWTPVPAPAESGDCGLEELNLAFSRATPGAPPPITAIPRVAASSRAGTSNWSIPQSATGWRSSLASSWARILPPPTPSSRRWTASPAARPITASRSRSSGRRRLHSTSPSARITSLWKGSNLTSRRRIGNWSGASASRRHPMARHLALARHHGLVCIRAVHGVLSRRPELRPRDPRAPGGGWPGGGLSRGPGLHRKRLGAGVSPGMDLDADEPLRQAGHLPHRLGRPHPLAPLCLSRFHRRFLVGRAASSFRHLHRRPSRTAGGDARPCASGRCVAR